jgi:hypothetical protein
MNTQFKKRVKRIAAIGLLSVVLLATVANAQQIWYVTQTGSGGQSGTSWGDAAPGQMLQSIIIQAGQHGGGQVWVAEGTYTISSQPSQMSFILYNKVELYGGFVGGETSLDQRDFVNNITTLDGANAGKNLHVVIIKDVEESRVDGFHIVNGDVTNADGLASDRSGGGILVISTSPLTNPVLANLEIYYNQANNGYGGGIAIYGDNANVFMYNCKIYYNTAWQGGGLFVDLGSSTFNNIEIFENHSSPSNGGGVYLECNTATFNMVNIYQNEANLNGAGMHCARSYPTLNDCNIYENTTHPPDTKPSGSGLHDYDCQSVLNNTNIYGNHGGTNNYEYEYAGGIICTNQRIISASNQNADFEVTLNAFIESSLQLRIYPNPVNGGGNLTLSLENHYGFYQGEVHVQIYSMDGRMLYRTTLDKGMNTLSVPELSPGVYVLNARIASGKKYNAQLVIH